MLPPFQLEQAISRTLREEWGRILAALVKSTGDLQLAEDALQDAVETALSHWPQQGLPASPRAWLIKTARHKAIDRMRRDANFAKLQPEISYLLDLQNDATEPDADAIPDKRLELMFTCCHPALEQKTRIALTLRTLGGLTTEEVARTFLDKPQTMAQRLARARKKIAVAGIPYEIPSVDALPERLAAVLQVIYLIFNEGYAASSGQHITRDDLAEEAIRLARICLQLMPEQTEIAGLLALMQLHDSRRYARQSNDGELIPLEQQNRRLWNRDQINQGVALLKDTLRKQRIGPYQLQAAISAVHAETDDWVQTDWPQIAALYQLLYTMQPSPVIRINQAVAISFADTADNALAMLDELGADQSLENYQPYHAARADILIRAGNTAQAGLHLRQAIALSDNDAEKRFLQYRLDSC